MRQLSRQSFKNFEVIVVDNASSDDSISFIKKNFPWAKIIKTDKNLGISGKNLGFLASRGEYIISLDSDAVIDVNCIEKFVGKLSRNKKLGIACASVYEINTERYLGPNRAISGNNREGYKVCFFNGSAIAFKKEIFEKTGGYSKDYFICLEELEWAVRILEHGFDVRCFTDIKIYNKRSKNGGDLRKNYGFWFSRNWILFYVQFLNLNAIPEFIFLHIKSFFKKTKNSNNGMMSKKDCIYGLISGLSLIPKFLPKRRPVKAQILNRIKSGLFPNRQNLYIES